MADFLQIESIWVQRPRIRGFYFFYVRKIDGFLPEANTACKPSKFQPISVPNRHSPTPIKTKNVRFLLVRAIILVAIPNSL